MTRGSGVGSWGGEPEGLGEQSSMLCGLPWGLRITWELHGHPKAAQEAIETLHMMRLGFLVCRKAPQKPCGLLGGPGAA